MLPIGMLSQQGILFVLIYEALSATCFIWDNGGIYAVVENCFV